MSTDVIADIAVDYYNTFAYLLPKLMAKEQLTAMTNLIS